MLMPDAQALVLLGLHHEQQHQELMLTDVQHLLSLNPLEPALYDAPNALPAPLPGPLHWIEGRQGLVEIGDDGKSDFAFDCETPRHKTVLHPHALARSEEHTSELQSIMPISYAVFCLKKKNNNHTTYHHH